MQTLILSKNADIVINVDTLAGLTNLKDLDLSDCRLTQVIQQVSYWSINTVVHNSLMKANRNFGLRTRKFRNFFRESKCKIEIQSRHSFTYLKISTKIVLTDATVFNVEMTSA